MKKIFLLRHFKTGHNQKKMISGQKDICIVSTDNHTQKIKNIELLYNFKKVSILTSPLKRCLAIAEFLATCISKNIQFEIIKLDELKERNFGIFEGELKSNIIKDFSNYFQNGKFNAEMTPPNGESLKKTLERVAFVLKKVEELNSDCIVICSHNHFMKLLYCSLMNLNESILYSFDFGNGTINDITNIKTTPTISKK